MFDQIKSVNHWPVYAGLYNRNVHAEEHKLTIGRNIHIVPTPVNSMK